MCHCSRAPGFRSAARNTACTPGTASASSVSTAPIRARANGLRTKQAWSIPGRDDVVDERARAREQAGILEPVDPDPRIPRPTDGTERPSRAHLTSPSRSAAACAAARPSRRPVLQSTTCCLTSASPTGGAGGEDRQRANGGRRSVERAGALDRDRAHPAGRPRGDAGPAQGSPRRGRGRGRYRGPGHRVRRHGRGVVPIGDRRRRRGSSAASTRSSTRRPSARWPASSTSTPRPGGGSSTPTSSARRASPRPPSRISPPARARSPTCRR